MEVIFWSREEVYYNVGFFRASARVVLEELIPNDESLNRSFLSLIPSTWSDDLGESFGLGVGNAGDSRLGTNQER